MIVPDKIKTFLSENKDVSLGYNEINFFDPENLDEEQIGYRVDMDSNSLITGNKGDWREEWIVIASDYTGDPIIIDVSSPKLTVLSAAHGEGNREPFVIADSMDNFKNIISILHDISKDRTNPDELENNPVKDKEKRNALTKIRQLSPDTENEYWENFFEND
jgi:hypothetical protein